MGKESRKKSSRKYYEKKSKDSEWMKKRNTATKKWRDKNPEKVRERRQILRKQHTEDYKMRCYLHYSERDCGSDVPCCACCHEKNLVFLTIDHRFGKTKEFPKKLISLDFYRKIVKKEFPSDFQVLCRNCNSGRYRNGGVCPHKTESR